MFQHRHTTEPRRFAAAVAVVAGAWAGAPYLLAAALWVACL